MNNLFLDWNSFRHAMLGVVLLGAGALHAQADTLASNLTATTSGTETASGDTLLAVSFGTGTSSYTLSDVQLLLDSTAGGTAELSLFSDGGLQPGNLLAQLTAPGTYSSSVSDSVFSSTGVNLDANTTYWLVLSAESGSFDWAWTSDNTGLGAGFQDTWAISSDAGSTWFSEDVYPLQFAVDAVADAATVTPEPGSLTLGFAGLFVVVAFVASRRRYRKLMAEFEREVGERWI